jgi:hypothetical protein
MRRFKDLELVDFGRGFIEILEPEKLARLIGGGAQDGAEQ